MSTKAQRTPIGLWIAAEAPLAPPREAIRLVKKTPMGETKVITHVAIDLKRLDDATSAVERASTMALMDETGKAVFTCQMLGAGGIILNEKDIKVQGQNTVPAENVQVVNNALVGMTRDVLADMKNGFGMLFEEARTMVSDARDDRKDWQNFSKGLLQENAELRAELAQARASSNPEQEGKGLVYAAAAATLTDLPTLLMKGLDAFMLRGGTKILGPGPEAVSSTDEQPTPSQQRAVSIIKDAARHISDITILRILGVMAMNQDSAKMLADAMNENEKAIFKPAFVACIKALQDVQEGATQ